MDTRVGRMAASRLTVIRGKTYPEGELQLAGPLRLLGGCPGTLRASTLACLTQFQFRSLSPDPDLLTDPDAGRAFDSHSEP
jgi:hypothetical protein